LPDGKPVNACSIIQSVQTKGQGSAIFQDVSDVVRSMMLSPLLNFDSTKDLQSQVLDSLDAARSHAARVITHGSWPRDVDKKHLNRALGPSLTELAEEISSAIPCLACLGTDRDSRTRVCGQPKFCHEMHRSFFKVTRERENAFLKWIFGTSYSTSQVWEGAHHFEFEDGTEFSAEKFVEAVLAEAMQQLENLRIQDTQKIRDRQALRHLPSRYTRLLRQGVMQVRRRKYLNTRRCFVCCDEFDVGSVTIWSDKVYLSLALEVCTEIYVCSQCVPEVRNHARVLNAAEAPSTVEQDELMSNAQADWVSGWDVGQDDSLWAPL